MGYFSKLPNNLTFTLKFIVFVRIFLNCVCSYNSKNMQIYRIICQISLQRMAKVIWWKHLFSSARAASSIPDCWVYKRDVLCVCTYTDGVFLRSLQMQLPCFFISFLHMGGKTTHKLHRVHSSNVSQGTLLKKEIHWGISGNWTLHHPLSKSKTGLMNVPYQLSSLAPFNAIFFSI